MLDSKCCISNSCDPNVPHSCLFDYVLGLYSNMCTVKSFKVFDVETESVLSLFSSKTDSRFIRNIATSINKYKMLRCTKEVFI